MIWSAILLLLPLGAQSVLAKCKCTPADECWPSTAAWDTLNSTVNGKLIRNQPLAVSCYPGQAYNAQSCEAITEGWKNSSVISKDPLGYSYPLFTTCPAINTKAGEHATCNLGNSPVYAINATEPEDVAAGLRFAQENNVRLVVKNTGHDIVGRSQGYGSLMIWIRYIRTGVQFHEHYTSAKCATNWTGAAFTVGGGYVWGELYKAAADRDHIVVGGDDQSVGVLGGYLQGAGHGPTSHHFGLGTDQVLEMTVVLASGETVVANACQNPDLFTALRGGGGGTFGVVVSSTIKAYPTVPVLGHELNIITLNASVEKFINVSADIVSKYPILSDAGFSGYASAGASDLLSAPKSVGVYTHSFGKMLPSSGDISSIIREAQSIADQNVVQDFLPYNGTAFLITSTFTVYPNFQKFYEATGLMEPVGTSNILMSSRLFNKESLQNNEPKVESMIRTIFSNPDDGTLSTAGTLFHIAMIGGGKVLSPQPYTSVNPGWRKAYALVEIQAIWTDDVDAGEVEKMKADTRSRKTDAMRDLTKGMGTYLNEADRLDPSWQIDFWGENYDWLKSVKQKYDPEQVFWCHPCVGSEGWVEVTGKKGYGPLCQKDSM